MWLEPHREPPGGSLLLQGWALGFVLSQIQKLSPFLLSLGYPCNGELRGHVCPWHLSPAPSPPPFSVQPLPLTDPVHPVPPERGSLSPKVTLESSFIPVPCIPCLPSPLLHKPICSLHPWVPQGRCTHSSEHLSGQHHCVTFYVRNSVISEPELHRETDLGETIHIRARFLAFRFWQAHPQP